MTSLAPRIGNDVSYVTRINHEIRFAWQAQYSVKLEGDFSRQAQHFVQFWEMAGARNVTFFHTKCVSKMDESGHRSGGCEMIISPDVLGSCSNRLYIGGNNSRISR